MAVHANVAIIIMIMIICEYSLGHKKFRCDCSHVNCRGIISKSYCHTLGGRFVAQSLDDCNCCSYCLIIRGPFNTCRQRIGFVVKCDGDTYCDAQNGLICMPKESGRKTIKEHRKNSYDRITLPPINPILTFFNRNYPTEGQRIHKRVLRSPNPYRIGLSLGHFNYNNQSHGMISWGERVDRNDHDAPFLQVNKRIDAINGGNANSINHNIGPTFIINNNYKFEHFAEVPHQHIVMDPNGGVSVVSGHSTNKSTQVVDQLFSTQISETLSTSADASILTTNSSLNHTDVFNATSLPTTLLPFTVCGNHEPNATRTVNFKYGHGKWTRISNDTNSPLEPNEDETQVLQQRDPNRTL